MLKTPGDVTAQDLQRWYKRGWVAVDGFTEPRLVLAARDDPKIISHTSGAATDKVAVDSPPSAVYAHWPKLGAVNVFGFAVHVYRLPLRVYRRTYNEEVLSYIIPNVWSITAKFGDPRQLIQRYQSEFVNAVWNPTYVGVQQAAQRILIDGAPSVAISRSVILTNTDMDEKVGVYYNGERVGYRSSVGAFWECGEALDALTTAKLNKELGL